MFAILMPRVRQQLGREVGMAGGLPGSTPDAADIPHRAMPHIAKETYR